MFPNFIPLYLCLFLLHYPEAFGSLLIVMIPVLNLWELHIKPFYLRQCFLQVPRSFPLVL